jgi:hypothetical protein
MTITAESVRAAILAAKNKGNRGNTSSNNGGDNASYPFWNIPEDSSATVRFLPDADPDNPFFWRNREVIRLEFQGVVGGEYPTDRQVTVTVPCVEMFGQTCPIISATRPWWKDPSKEALARKYWKKRSYIFQGFVVNSPIDEKNTPENPIRRFVINPSIYDLIEKSLASPDMEELPCHYTGGRDFKIAKTRKGEYANYSTSSWSFKTRPLTDTEFAAIDKYGLFDLKEYLGRKPDSDELAAIKAMFEDSLNGAPFDMDSFGKWFRPYGGRDDDNGSAQSSRTVHETVSRLPEPTPRPVTEAAPAPAPAAAAPAAGGRPNPAEILDRIRARTANQSK